MNWQRTLEHLRSDPRPYAAISRSTGIHWQTIRRISNGQTPTPRVDVAQKLANYYDGQGR